MGTIITTKSESEILLDLRMLNHQSGPLAPSHVNNKDDTQRRAEVSAKKETYHLTKLLSQTIITKFIGFSQNQQGDYFEFTAHSSLLPVCSLPHLSSDSSLDGWQW